MISENFSTARYAVECIYKMRESESLIYREVIPRIIGVALSALLVFDFIIHLAGVVESTFYALRAALIEQKPVDFYRPLKHLKCLLLFIQQFPSASVIGLIYPDVSAFAFVEHDRIGAIRGLLLSRDKSQYTDQHHIEWGCFMKYIQSLSDQKRPVTVTTQPYISKMDNTVPLLKDAIDLLEDFGRLQFRNHFSNPISRFLAGGIEILLQQDSTLLQRIIFKECLSRVLALALSVVAVVEFFFHCVGFFEIPILFLLLGNTDLSIGSICKEMGWNIVLSIIQILFGSLIGLLSPALASRMMTPDSRSYDAVRFSMEDIYNKVLTNTANLKENESFLVPISLPYDDGAHHAITVLVNRDSPTNLAAEYSISILNKGYGAKSSVLSNDTIKCAVNETRCGMSETELSGYFKNLFDMLSLSEAHLCTRAEEMAQTTTLPDAAGTDSNVSKMIYDTYRNSLLPGDDATLHCKPQVSGDCPKASSLAGLYYHYWKNQPDKSALGYKLWLHNIKRAAYEADSHLLDIALGSPLAKERPSVAARERLNAKRAKGGLWSFQG